MRLRFRRPLALLCLLLLLLPACTRNNSAPSATDESAATDENITAAIERSPEETVPAVTEPPSAPQSSAAAPAVSAAPLPEEAPVPAPAAEEPAEEDKVLSCTISISCAAINDNLADLDPSKAELVPADGWLLAPESVEFYEGESVFNVLLRTCKERKIHLEYENTPLYGSAYIQGIGNLYEFDCGDLSGWLYCVNGFFPNYGCSLYELNDGDVIELIYTCDLGTSQQTGMGVE